MNINLAIFVADVQPFFADEFCVYVMTIIDFSQNFFAICISNDKVAIFSDTIQDFIF